MDIPGSYRGGTYTKHISRKEIENMKKNMKKVPVIQLKTEIYHNKEVNEAEKILGKISSLPIENISLSPQQTKSYHGIISYIISLRERFISHF